MIRHRPSRVAPPPGQCPLTECMSVIGGTWTPNIIWYLGAGPRRFNELRGDVGDVSAKVLSGRLKRLQRDGVVDRRVMPTAPPSVEYELTDLGRELLPAVEAIVDVGRRLKELRPVAVSPAGGRRAGR